MIKKENKVDKKSIAAVLMLEDGLCFMGNSFGAEGEGYGEVVFNTSMTGYQEILTDPSYEGQMVTMTYPLIGNYGVNSEDVESSRPHASGLIVRENSRTYSNWRATKSLNDYMKEFGVIGIEGIDTRELTRHIRIKGAMKGVISTTDLNERSLRKKVARSPGLIGRDLVQEVTVEKAYEWNEAGTFKVVVLDCGVKTSILEKLSERGARVVVMPYSARVDVVMREKPDGIVLSNGPGDPAAVKHITGAVKELMGNIPIFGICLGHQILALAAGGTTYKLRFGHHGGNHPVKDMRTGRICITTQNHGFCVDINTLDPKDFEITHINLNDKTLEGMRHKSLPVFSIQFHPEAGPGPYEAEYLFDEFIASVKHGKN